MSGLRLEPHSETAVTVARFRDRYRAVRLRDWMHRSHIAATLAAGDDGRLELWVERHEERRAVDLLLAVFLGPDIDHIPAEPPWRRAQLPESTLAGAALAIVVMMLGLIAWVIAPVVPFLVVPTAGVVTFVVVAAMPGGSRPREYGLPPAGAEQT